MAESNVFYKDLDDSVKSKFNAAMAKIIRLDRIRQGVIDARLVKNYNDWYNCIQVWRSELNERFKPVDDAIANTYEQLIGEALNRTTLIYHPLAGYESKPHYRNNELLDYLLGKYELWLGSKEYKFGMSIPDGDDPRYVAAN